MPIRSIRSVAVVATATASLLVGVVLFARTAWPPWQIVSNQTPALASHLMPTADQELTWKHLPDAENSRNMLLSKLPMRRLDISNVTLGVVGQLATSHRLNMRSTPFSNGHRMISRPMRESVRLHAYVTPIGPFCPFRSSQCADGSPVSKHIMGMPDMARFASDMSRLQLDMQMGNKNPELMNSVADQISASISNWESMLTRLRLSDDFQCREYYKITMAWAERNGQNPEVLGKMMKWQADNLRAFAAGGAPLPPPAGVDMSMVMKAQQNQQPGSGPQNPMMQVAAAQDITSKPFTGEEAPFKSEVVREEWQRLCNDHVQLIKNGEEFGNLDSDGKVAYLDALEAIEERWDVFYARFALMDALNPDFQQQTGAYLKSMGMSVEVFREVIKEAHSLMRTDAQIEGLRKNLGGDSRRRASSYRSGR